MENLLSMRFFAEKLSIFVPPGVEACWLHLRPKEKSLIKNLVIASIYVSPSSKFKTATLNHIIETIHILRSQFDNDVIFIISGDFNRLNIENILDSYTALRQVVENPTRKSAILEFVITDLHSLYQPPQILPPLEVDTDKVGKDSDHEIIILAPILSSLNSQRQKRTVKSRPIDNAVIEKFTQFFATHPWDEVLKVDDIDTKVNNFHQTMRSKLDEFCPEKEYKVSVLDRKWMTPELKTLNRKIKREFFKNRKSKKWQFLRNKFKKKKRYIVKNFYQKFVNELKESDPSKWYSIAKRIGTDPNSKTDGSLVVDCLKGLSDSDSAEKVAEHFSQISNEYQPLNTVQLPSYLPANEVLIVDQKTVINSLLKLKLRKSTQPCDLPSRIRKQFAVQLSVPLTDIINSCLQKHHYPDS